MRWAYNIAEYDIDEDLFNKHLGFGYRYRQYIKDMNPTIEVAIPWDEDKTYLKDIYKDEYDKLCHDIRGYCAYENWTKFNGIKTTGVLYQLDDDMSKKYRDVYEEYENSLYKTILSECGYEYEEEKDLVRKKRKVANKVKVLKEYNIL